MPRTVRFDRLNEASSKSIRLDVEAYFREMDIPKSKQDLRINLARRLEEVIATVLDYTALSYEDFATVDWEYARAILLAEMSNVVNDMVGMDSFLEDLLEEDVDRIIENTRDGEDGLRQTAPVVVEEEEQEGNVPTTISGEETENWWTSEVRALYIAEDEAQAVAGHEDLAEALAAGYTHKTWMSLMDGRERKTHHNEHGTTIPITERFVLGAGARLLYPGDTSDNGGEYPEEIVNCRCWLEFS